MTNVASSGNIARAIDPDMPVSDRYAMLQVYWQEWEYRHKSIWSFYYKALFAICFIIALPFLAQDYVKGTLNLRSFGVYSAGLALFIFPVLSYLIAYFSNRVLRSEYSRFHIVNKAYRELIEASIKQWSMFNRYDQPFPEIEKAHFELLMDLSFKVGFLASLIEVFFLFAYSAPT